MASAAKAAANPKKGGGDGAPSILTGGATAMGPPKGWFPPLRARFDAAVPRVKGASGSSSAAPSRAPPRQEAAARPTPSAATAAPAAPVAEEGFDSGASRPVAPAPDRVPIPRSATPRRTAPSELEAQRRRVLSPEDRWPSAAPAPTAAPAWGPPSTWQGPMVYRGEPFSAFGGVPAWGSQGPEPWGMSRVAYPAVWGAGQAPGPQTMPPAQPAMQPAQPAMQPARPAVPPTDTAPSVVHLPSAAAPGPPPPLGEGGPWCQAYVQGRGWV